MKDLELKFIEELKILNRSPETIKTYIFYLRKFFSFLLDKGITDILTVKYELIKEYQTHLYYETNHWGRQSTVRTQNNALKAVKIFFRFLMENDYIIRDPARDVQYARVPQTLPRNILKPREAKRVIHAPDTRCAIGYRDRAILEVLYSTGIRKSELISIKIQDVDYNEGYIRVTGKGGKERVVPLGKIACRYVENYIKMVRPEFIRDWKEDILFLSLKRRRLSKNVPIEIVKKYAKEAGIKKKVSTHTFRHTCATHMLKNNANIRHIQEMLGHAKLDTTQEYTRITITELKETHRKYHPRERDRE